MKCYNHPNEDTVAQCQHCGKGLCEKCAQKWSSPICDDCQRNLIDEELASVNSELRVYIIAAVVGAILVGAGSIPNGLGNGIAGIIWGAIVFPMYPAGWKWLNHLTDYFVFLGTPVFWLIYLIIKLVLSAIVGIVALPYRLFTIYRRRKALAELRAYTE